MMKTLLAVICFCLTLHLASAGLKRVDKKRAMQNECSYPGYYCEEDEECCLSASYCNNIGICSCVSYGKCSYSSDCCSGYCYSGYCSGSGR